MNARSRVWVQRTSRLAIAAAASVLVACNGAHGRAGVPRSAARASISPSTTQASLPEGAAPGTTVVATLTSSATERSYRLHTPASFHAGQSRPLVVVLHGATGNARRVELRYHWDALSDRDGFFVVYPQGVLDQWNAVLDPRAADDVGFLSVLIDNLVGRFSVDPGRVYVAGMSNGGAMTYRIGCALADRIAAIAPVEGANPGCRPARPVSMLAVHGLADHQVSFASAQQSVAVWRDSDGCPADAQTRRSGPVTHSVWAPCTAGTAVELYAVDGSGHEWPGSSPPLPGHDPPSRDLDATQVIWDFFRQQQR
jgi:polyhydroxybutyrate depolymerase